MNTPLPKIHESGQAPLEERKSARLALYLPISVLQAGKVTPARLIDVSERGCKIAVAVTVNVGKNIEIAVTGFSQLKGCVAWQNRTSFGVDFADPISRAEVEYLVGLAADHH